MIKKLVVLIFFMYGVCPSVLYSAGTTYHILGFPDVRTSRGTSPNEFISNWGVRAVQAHRAHNLGYFGAKVKIAVLDTGIDYTHPKLITNYAGGYDFTNDDVDPMDDNGHGTHVAGIIAAELNGFGIIGVAPEAKIYSLKVCDRNGYCDEESIIKALDWCITNKIQITNSSFGGAIYSEELKQAYEKAWNAGILHVAAAGNDGPVVSCPHDNLNYPGAFNFMVSVGAIERSGRAAIWSSMPPTVVAPGNQIFSTVPGGGFESWSGTSMASPHVVGVAALLLERGIFDRNKNGRKNDEAFRHLTMWTRQALGARCERNKRGNGLVDAWGLIWESSF